MQGQQLGEGLAHFPAGDDLVHKAVLLQILGPLEALGQLLADGLLDDPGTGKADERPSSARVMSPREAKLAVTPPVVGWVRKEMYSPPA